MMIRRTLLPPYSWSVSSNSTFFDYGNPADQGRQLLRNADINQPIDGKSHHIRISFSKLSVFNTLKIKMELQLIYSLINAAVNYSD